jgi:hypothetical protein
MNKWNNENDPFGPFDFGNFKKWMKKQPDVSSKSNMVGFQVESKVTFKKLLSRIDTQDGILEDVAKTFKKSGGIIKEVDGNNVLIEVDSGSFIIHRMYIKRQD